MDYAQAFVCDIQPIVITKAGKSSDYYLTIIIMNET